MCLARRWLALAAETASLDEQLEALTAAVAPTLIALNASPDRPLTVLQQVLHLVVG